MSHFLPPFRHGLLVLALFVPLAGALTPVRADDRLMAVGQFPEALLDADHDGVSDLDDNCPGTEPSRLIRGESRPTVVDICGCPIDPCAGDADQDGIGDCDDRCPDTARGLKVGAQGCPVPQKKPQDFVLDVKFKFAEANLQDEYVPDLDQLRELLLRLPELTVTLAGHTDSKGSDSYNLALSRARADKCRKYLLADPRIAAERVTAIGYGESQPVASNDDEAGRAQNRRTVASVKYLFEFTPPNDGSRLPQ